MKKQIQKTEWIMGMPITVTIKDASEEKSEESIRKVFEYFTYIDNTFSTYKNTSEISGINRGEIPENQWSTDMQTVFALSEKTKQETGGYFDIRTPEGPMDPSGLVKGWSIYNAANILSDLGYTDFYIDAGGDIELRGKNVEGKNWTVGIRDPFSNATSQIIKTLALTDCGMATSGTYIRGQHIYDPHQGRTPLQTVASITVIGPNVYEADRFATAAFAMGEHGIHFIENLTGFEGYSIDSDGVATMTSGFHTFVI
jgi:FAD:protein FMN transferase